MEDILYRIANETDFEQLFHLKKIVYGPFHEQMTGEHKQQWINQVNESKKLLDLFHSSTCLVAELNGQLVASGYLVASGKESPYFEKDWASLRNIGVDPAHRKKGIAKKLTLELIELARKNKETTIALHTSEMMTTARKMYEKMGFIRVKDLAPLFGKKYWVYTLPL